MKFDVTATIKEVGAIETVGDSGFQKRSVILTEQSGDYENLVCVEFSGDKITDPERYTPGQKVKVGGFINCREWEGRYFTSLRGSFIQTDRSEGEVPQTQVVYGTATMPEQPIQNTHNTQQYQPPQPQGNVPNNPNPVPVPQQQYQQPNMMPNQQQGFVSNDPSDDPIPF